MFTPKNKPVHLRTDGHYLFAEYWLKVSEDISDRGGDPTLALATAQVHATLASVPCNPEYVGVESHEFVEPHLVERFSNLPGDTFANPHENGKENA